jgi:hypothetical protein
VWAGHGCQHRSGYKQNRIEKIGFGFARPALIVKSNSPSTVNGIGSQMEQTRQGTKDMEVEN